LKRSILTILRVYVRGGDAGNEYAARRLIDVLTERATPETGEPASSSAANSPPAVARLRYAGKLLDLAPPLRPASEVEVHDVDLKRVSSRELATSSHETDDNKQ